MHLSANGGWQACIATLGSALLTGSFILFVHPCAGADSSLEDGSTLSLPAGTGPVPEGSKDGKSGKKSGKSREYNSEAVRIKNIRVEGCKQVSRRSVKAILQQEETPWWRIKLKEGGYDPFWAEEDQRRIEQFYRSRGFYSVRVDEPELEFVKGGEAVKITYRIEEGGPVHVDDIEIIFEDGTYEEADLERMRSLLGYKEGDRFEQVPYQDAARAMQDYYKDNGFFRAAVERQAEVDTESKKARVVYSITRGQRYRIRSIDIEGCEKTKEEVVKKAITLREGQWYSRKGVFENQRSIQRLPIYQTVRLVEEADDENLEVGLLFKVEEGKAREVKVGVGYGSEEGVRVQAGWRHNNFLGGARELSVFARWSGLLEKEEVKIIQPNLPRAGDFVQVSTVRQVRKEESYTNESLALSPAYHFNLSPHLWSEVSYRIEQNNLTDVLDVAAVQEEDLAREGMLSAVSDLLDFSDVDNLIKPTMGVRTSVYLEFGGGPLGGDFSYNKAVGEARGYYPIYAPFVGAARLKAGWAEPTGDLDLLPLFKRFYTGGSGSVRGFERYQLGPLDPDEKPIGGAKLLEAGSELRFPVYGKLGGVVFMEGGWVWLEEEEYDLEDIVYSTGFGLRYDTPIGPLSLDAGFPLSTDPVYPDYMIHFNIGEAF